MIGEILAVTLGKDGLFETEKSTYSLRPARGRVSHVVNCASAAEARVAGYGFQDAIAGAKH